MTKKILDKLTVLWRKLLKAEVKGKEKKAAKLEQKLLKETLKQKQQNA